MSAESESLLDFNQVLKQERALIDRTRLESGGANAGDATVGLALSGGGIRSATFCLGVLQALAKARKLPRVDYLSTVSGGGYIGAFLSAWIQRSTLAGVTEALAGDNNRVGGTPEAPEVTWLRRYSNYLAPKLGFFSADSLVLVTTWLRNVLLNLIIFITLLAAVFLLPRLLLGPAAFAAERLSTALGFSAAWLAFILLPLGITLHFSAYFVKDAARSLVLMNSTGGVFLLVILPGALASILGSVPLFFGEGATGTSIANVALAAAVMLALTGIVAIAFQFTAPDMSGTKFGFFDWVVFGGAYSAAIAVGAALVVFFVSSFKFEGEWWRAEKTAQVLTFGPPALMLTLGAMGTVVVGLVGRSYYERTREWWSRLNAWFIIIGVTWLVLVSLSFYAVPVLAWGRANLEGWATAVGFGWVGSLLTTLFVKRPATAERATGKLISVVLNVALTVVVAGILLFVAGGVGAVLESLGPEHQKASKYQPQAQPAVELRVSTVPGDGAVVKLVPAPEKKPVDLRHFLNLSFEQQDRIQRSCYEFRKDGGVMQMPPGGNYFDCEMSDLRFSITVLAFLGCFILCLAFSLRVDVNKFSLHNLYKNRLIRCYLGASRQDRRRAHPFTGFDERDDMPLSRLAGIHRDPTKPKVVNRPFHIINAALNITQGRNLAWQERKAASFTFTPLHCGFTLGASAGDAREAEGLSPGYNTVGGYRSSEFWAGLREERRSFTLGMAMATSGAAVSPNRGMGTTPATAFLATLFNIRLGRWSPNPLSRVGWMKSSPYFGIYYLLSELFGYSKETSEFVYLSDGGHFDNTGVYELVRRRCATILVVDATADLARGYEDLANLVRKCRVDFGVEINFSFEKLGTANRSDSPSKGYVVGSVKYPELQEPATIIVLKPTLIKYSKLGVDLFSYSRGRASFPHQTTVDQFFSESQLESYRALGQRIAEACLDDRAVRI